MKNPADIIIQGTQVSHTRVCRDSSKLISMSVAFTPTLIPKVIASIIILHFKITFFLRQPNCNIYSHSSYYHQYPWLEVYLEALNSYLSFINEISRKSTIMYDMILSTPIVCRLLKIQTATVDVTGDSYQPRLQNISY